MLKRAFAAIRNLATAAAVSGAIAAGGIALPAYVLQRVVGDAKLVDHTRAQARAIKSTLHEIAGHVNGETLFAFPGYERLARRCSVVRRTMVDRVKLLKKLELEKHGICVIVERRDQKPMRDPDDRVRANRYWIFVSAELAARAGLKLHYDGEGEWCAMDDSGADGFAALEEPPAPEPSPDEPQPVETPSTGAAAGDNSPGPPPPAAAPSEPVEAPCRAETDEERLVREAMLEHPCTADFVDNLAGWVAIARNPGKDKHGKAIEPKSLAQQLAAICDIQRKTLPTDSRSARWRVGVSFLIAALPIADDKPRIAPAKLRELNDKELRDRDARRRVDAETARALGIGAPDTSVLRAAEEARRVALTEKQRDQRAALAQWASHHEKPPDG